MLLLLIRCCFAHQKWPSQRHFESR